MKPHQRIILIVLLVLLAAAVAGVVLTRRPPSPGRARHRQKRELVDQRPLETARNLAALAASPGERAYAARALRLADDEVDLAFAIALRDAAAHPPPPTPETQALVDRIKQLQARVDADQQSIAQLKQAPESKHAEEVQQQVDLAQAELSLDQDALSDARKDLSRAGGDLHGTIQRLMEEHEAGTHANAAVVPESQAPAARETTTLLSRWHDWVALRDRHKQLLTAEEEATAAVAALTQAHETLAEQLKQQRAAFRSARQSGGAQQASTALSRAKEIAEDEKTLSDFDRRIKDEEDLSGVYRDWATLVARRQQRSLNAILRSVALILLICVVAFVADHLVGHLEARLTPDRRMLRSLRFIARFGVQVVALALILLVIFGAPGQVTTLLGLAGAGLTVALKDFIVAFFGWFVLMGKNGIRVGDWVEINGVGGEVIEIGILKTVLLEMGNWASTGHPTGRRVAFVNSFAIEGHYFNFSTAGQWLWDELQLTLPAGGDAYQMAQQIRDAVERATDADARQAGQDWERVTRQYGVRTFSARPVVDLRPGPLGLDVIVRYITRAPQRYEVKSRLFQVIVELVHKPAAAAHSGRGSGIAGTPA
ncbi:MAG TPA: mechanosensitive ion channel domain-containing protein [Terriglobales bacterium]|nr:mechanosensitive ion channel domain-containing protein [Terriglobales bacterium]